MNIMNYWETWVIIYLISAVVFAQSFKIANRKMKNAGSLTILLEVFTALFSTNSFDVSTKTISLNNNLMIIYLLLPLIILILFGK